MSDQIFDALADRTRRQLLLALREQNSQDDSLVLDVPWEVQESEQARIQRHHTHLPKLDDYGFIDWDSESGLVERGPRYSEIEPLLATAASENSEKPDEKGTYELDDSPGGTSSRR